ncbi:WD40 repeat-like protein [Amylocystis lapponica]|nr:WD40 repeat-like protein [Amylocystis lapponica]
MLQTGLIPNAHNDLVTDAAYDFYGLRLATCSLDQRIKVWQLDERSGSWSVEDDWKAHDAAVTKVSWAHPEFGTVLASASFDRTVKVWEQVPATDADSPQANGGAGPSSGSRWVERAMLVDAKGTVHFGLKLAMISSDNYLRVYECLEQPSLTTWQLAEEVDILSLPATSPLSGSLSQTADGGWCISWCKDRYWGEVIATGCGISGVVKSPVAVAAARNLLTLDPSPPLSGEGTTKASPAADGDAPTPFAITSVAWAPSCGRSYHLIATGGRDGHVRIWRARPPTSSDEQDGEDEAEGGRWAASVVGDFDDHKSGVGRVEWNITGTILSSAGNDGRIRLWKVTAGSVWRPAGHISVEQAEEPDVDMDDHVVED